MRSAILSGADLSECDLCSADLQHASLALADLRNANLSFARLEGAELRGASLLHTNLVGADLRGANLNEADLRTAALRGASLADATLSGADLSRADFSQANLSRADLINTRLIETNFQKALLSGCLIYGASAWGIELDGATQENLVLTPANGPAIIVDHLDIAQFIYLLLHSRALSEVVDSVASRFVLILGCFAPDRADVLDEMQTQLRRNGYAPISIDCDEPHCEDVAATVCTLAQLSRFIVLDVTAATGVLRELHALSIDFPPVPMILVQDDRSDGSSPDTQQYPWAADVFRYSLTQQFATLFAEQVIGPAEAIVAERSGSRSIREPAFLDVA